MRIPGSQGSSRSDGQPLWTITVWPVTPHVGQPLLQLDASVFINGEAGQSPSNEVRSVRGRRGRAWDGLPVGVWGVFVRPRRLKSWQMKPAGAYPGRDTLYGI